jgi:hypothetical protein
MQLNIIEFKIVILNLYRLQNGYLIFECYNIVKFYINPGNILSLICFLIILILLLPHE